LRASLGGPGKAKPKVAAAPTSAAEEVQATGTRDRKAPRRSQKADEQPAAPARARAKK